MPKGDQRKGGPTTPEGKAKAMANLRPGSAQDHRGYKNGLFSEEMRERLRPIVLNSATLLENILTGQPVTQGNPDPTAGEVINAFKAVAPYVMTELKPVMDETLCRIVADVLAEDERIPFEVIGDVVAKLIAKLNNESPSFTRSASGDTSKSR